MTDPTEVEWKVALALRKGVEQAFWLLTLAGQHGDKNDAIQAEVLLRRAAMNFDEMVNRDEWDQEEK